MPKFWKFWARRLKEFHRKWIFDHAIRLNLTGYAKNLKRYDEVEIVIQGNIKNLKKMIEISKIGPELANVIRIEFSKIFNQKKYTNFDIKWCYLNVLLIN